LAVVERSLLGAETGPRFAGLLLRTLSIGWSEGADELLDGFAPLTFKASPGQNGSERQRIIGVYRCYGRETFRDAPDAREKVKDRPGRREGR